MRVITAAINYINIGETLNTRQNISISQEEEAWKVAVLMKYVNI